MVLVTHHDASSRGHDNDTAGMHPFFPSPGLVYKQTSLRRCARCLQGHKSGILACCWEQEEEHDALLAAMSEQLVQLQAACARQLTALDTLHTQVRPGASPSPSACECSRPVHYRVSSWTAINLLDRSSLLDALIVCLRDVIHTSAWCGNAPSLRILDQPTKCPFCILVMPVMQDEQAGLAADQANIEAVCRQREAAEVDFLDGQLKVCGAWHLATFFGLADMWNTHPEGMLRWQTHQNL